MGHPKGRSEAEDGAAVDALGVRRLSGLFGGECCHHGNSHSADTSPDSGPEPDTGRSAAEDGAAVDAPGVRRLFRAFSGSGVIFNSEGGACTCTYS